MPKNIYKVHSGYQVRLVRDGTQYSKTFRTQREARRWRDQKLKELPPIERPEQWSIQGRTGVKGIGFSMKRQRGEHAPYVLASWKSGGKWHNRCRSINAHGLKSALMQCLRLLKEADYLHVSLEEAHATALPRLEALLQEARAEQEAGAKSS